MTIALGIRAATERGIVLASDTEVSYGGMKVSESKIMTASGVQLGKPTPNWVSPGDFAIVGSGDKGYVDAFSQELCKTFLDNSTLLDDVLMNKFGDHLRKFYGDNVIPFLELPEDERPDIEMLIGVFRHPMLDLFVTDRTTIRRAPLFVAVGSGGPFAERLLRRLWRPTGIREMQVLAAYIVHLTKESVPGCGQSTMVSAVWDDKAILSEPKVNLDELDKAFKEKWAMTEHKAVWSLITEYLTP